MTPIFRALGLPLVLAAATLCFSEASGWACDSGGCNNRLTETMPIEERAGQPQDLACNTNECLRPDSDAATLKPFTTACMTSDCLQPDADASEVKPLVTACSTSEC